MTLETVSSPATLAGKTVYLTGATGFLGGEVAHRLAVEGAHIRALVRDPARAAYIRDLPNLELVQGDLSAPVGLAGCDVVIHVAAALGGSLAVQLAANRDGTRTLAEAAADAGVQRFVHVSTVSLYGYANQADVDESTPPAPSGDPYPVSKLAAEEALKAVATARGLAYSIIRPGMIYGARSGMWTGKMFRVANRTPTVFIGDGSGSCYAIHVDDVADLTVLLATHPAAVGETFNCTPDPSPTWRDFLGGYAALAGRSRWLGVPPLLMRPVAALCGWFAPKSSPLRDLPALLPFSQRYITYKTTKAQRLLGWQAKVSLADGIASCVPWLRSQGLLK